MTKGSFFMVFGFPQCKFPACVGVFYSKTFNDSMLISPSTQVLLYYKSYLLRAHNQNI